MNECSISLNLKSVPLTAVRSFVRVDRMTRRGRTGLSIQCAPLKRLVHAGYTVACDRIVTAALADIRPQRFSQKPRACSKSQLPVTDFLPSQRFSGVRP